MNPVIRRTFDEKVTPAEALRYWAADLASLEYVTSTENFVYRFRHADGGICYLRLTHHGRRSAAQTAAEIHFVSYLHAHGGQVAPPVPTRDGQLVVTLETPIGGFSAVAFRGVTGDEVTWGTDKHNRDVLFERGAALARLHRLSENYEPIPNGPRRLHWYEDDLFTDPLKYLPETETAARAVYEDLIHWMLARPRTRQNYGMIHGDFGSFNMLRQPAAAAGGKPAGSVVAYDFDDCCFHWFTYDLAVAIRSARKLPEHYRIAYVQVLLEGYASERDLCGDGPAEIDRFARLAALYRFISLLRKYDLSNLEPDQRAALDERRGVLAHPPRWCPLPPD